MIHGLDVSQWNSGVNLRVARDEGIEFFAARVMSAALKGQGTDRPKQLDPMWSAFRDLGRELWPDTFYCYVRVGWGQTAASQVADFARHNPDRSIPVMVDYEQGGGPISHFHAVSAELVDAGYKLTDFAYFPDHWWAALGEPDLGGLNVWRSEYPDRRAVHFTEAYKAVTAAHWSDFGGGHTVGLQYSGFARVGNYSPLCVNAFRGTRAELSELLGYRKPGPAPVDDDHLAGAYAYRLPATS